MVKTLEQLEARALRERGRPYRRIARELGVSVASAHRWTSDIELSEGQREHNRSAPTGPQNRAHRAAGQELVGRLQGEAPRLPGAWTRARARAAHDPLHVLGCMLYRAEGAKNCHALSGVATLVVTRTWAVQHIFGAIQEYVGIDRPEWLETPSGYRRRRSP